MRHFLLQKYIRGYKKRLLHCLSQPKFLHLNLYHKKTFQSSIDILKELNYFLSKNLHTAVYSDADINLLENRGYLKNLHIAQLLQHSNITKKDQVLHIGGLTGYITLILSKLSNNVFVIENDSDLLKQLEENLSKFNLTNVEIINNDFQLGYKNKSPYDLIFIDNPLQELQKDILKQLSSNNGRLVMIERINDTLGKGILITKNNNNFNKEVLFDVFSKFNLYQPEKKFIF